MNRTVTFSPEARTKLVEGVNILANAVGVTLGPKGRNVVIDTYGVPSVTKDGVTVAREIILSDPIQRLGANIVKQAAQKTAQTAGDGTTTATVLAQALINNGVDLISKGYSPIEITRTYENLHLIALEHILSISKPVTLENIRQIATISANNDPTIGDLIYQGFEFVGLDGTIAVDDSKTDRTYVSTVEGTSFNTGIISPYFYTDPPKQETSYEDPLILITDKKIRSTQELVPALELAARNGRALIIIADEVEAQALSLLVVNRVRMGLSVAAIKAPGFGERRLELLKDLAILTGATLISDAENHRLEHLKLDQLGTAKRIISTNNSTTLVSPQGDQTRIQERITELKQLLSDPTLKAYPQEKINERLSNLQGKVAVLYIGAPTETEVKEKKDRIDDALRATKSAVALGYVPGGGTVLAKSAQFIEQLNQQGQEEFISSSPLEQAFLNALSAPMELILQNANISNTTKFPDNLGLNALTGALVDLEKDGIIDPTLVVTESLTSAVSATKMVLLSEVTIHDNQPKYDPRDSEYAD